MRGFLAAYSTLPIESPDFRSWEARLAAWEALLPGPVTGRARLGSFACLCHGDDAAGRMLRTDAAGGSATLIQGPRVGLTGMAPEGPYPAADPAAWKSRRDLYTGGRETAVIVHYSGREGALVVKTDLLNSTFLYCLELEGVLLLSDSSRTLRRIAGAGIDPLAAAEFVATGSIYGNKSLYLGIRTLAPSRVFAWQPGRAAASAEYWKPEETPFGSLGLERATDALIGMLDADFLRLKASGGRFVFDLTGGYDSRCNLAFALRNRLPLRTIVSGPADSGDVRIASAISARYGLSLTHATRPAPDRLSQAWAAAADCTDMEYDLLEYAGILDIHTRNYSPGEASVHGSTADVMRNYFLLPGFYRRDPEDALELDALIGKKFLSAVPAVPAGTFFHPRLGLDWTSHMRAQIAGYDKPELPAFARLDIIYLRIRMQFWQGRISSSTNRIHPSFTPWTHLEALETILATRWQDKRKAMLSRNLLSRIGGGLDRFPLDSPGVAGIGWRAELAALPRAAAYYARRARQKWGPGPRKTEAGADGVRAAVAAGKARLEPYLSGQGLDLLSREGGVSATVLGRLFTLLKACEEGG